MTKLTVTVKQKAHKLGNGYEGCYQLPSSTTSKLSLKDGGTVFPNVGSLKSTARRLGTKLGWETEFVEPAKKVAKKSVKASSTKKASQPKTKAKKVTTAVTNDTASSQS